MIAPIDFTSPRRAGLSRVAFALGGLAAAAFAVPALAADATVDFSTQVIGTEWGGSAGTPPGVTQFTEDSIEVAFVPMTSGAYGIARIDPPLPLFGTDEIMRLNNITTRFDLSAFDCVEQVTLRYIDFGGNEELRVNGAAVYTGDIAGVPAAIAPGVTATVTVNAVPGGKRGTITLDGDVQSFAIAGQEFWIDDICATVCDDPPPGGDCDRLMDFESLPLDEKWGEDVGTVPGDIQFDEDGIKAGFVPNTNGDFNLAATTEAFNGMGDGVVMCLQNIAMFVETGGAGPVSSVEFEYLDLGGTEEIWINGVPVFVGQISSAPFNIAPGVTCSVTSQPAPGGVRGVVALTGPVDVLHIAGQELWVDNICVTADDGTPPPDCDHLMDYESQPLGSQWGAAFGTPPGVPQFSEDGLDAAFEPNTSGAFNEARIIASFSGVGSGRILALNNIAFFTKPGAVGLVERVEFVFADLGGTEELQVNDAPIFVGNLASAPVAIAPGVTCTVLTAPIPGGIRGRVILDGPVETLRVAGQEFAMDDICVTLAPEPPCVGDVDDSGTVDFADVLAVLAAFGPCPGCPADVDGSGIVNFADLLTVLSAWGPC